MMSYLDLNSKLKSKMKAKGTRALGIVRLDLIKECRHRVEFLDHMVKDFEDRERAHMLTRGPRARIA
jgi:hypothetical protein